MEAIYHVVEHFSAHTGQIIFGIIVIGIIGLVSDFAFKWANQRLFFWSLA